MAISAVTMRVQDALGDFVAVASRIAALVIRWPTLRTSIRLRPCSVSVAPSGAV